MAAPSIADLRAAVDDLLHHKTPGLEPYWNGITRDALELAKVDVFNIFAERGYTQAQIDAADQIGIKVKFQALYWAGELNRADLTVEDSASLKALDQRESLKALTLTVNGVVVAPGVTAVAVSASGSFAWPTSGTARNPFMTDPIPRRCGDIPFPGI